MAEPIEWQMFHPRSPRAQWTVALLAGLAFGGGLAIPAIAAIGVQESWARAIAAVLVVAPATAAAALGRYRGARERTPLADALAVDAAGVRWIPVAGAVAAALALTVSAVGSPTAVNLALASVAVGAVGFVVVQTLRCSGRFDPDSATATVQGRVYDLERAPTTTLHVGFLTVVIVRRPTRDPLARYGVVAMPPDVYRRATQSTAGVGL